MHKMRAEVGYRVVAATSIRKADRLWYAMELVMIDRTLRCESLRMIV